MWTTRKHDLIFNLHGKARSWPETLWTVHEASFCFDFPAESTTCNFLERLKLQHVRMTSFVNFFSISFLNADVHLLLTH